MADDQIERIISTLMSLKHQSQGSHQSLAHQSLGLGTNAHQSLGFGNETVITDVKDKDLKNSKI